MACCCCLLLALALVLTVGAQPCTYNDTVVCTGADAPLVTCVYASAAVLSLETPYYDHPPESTQCHCGQPGWGGPNCDVPVTQSALCTTGVFVLNFTVNGRPTKYPIPPCKNTQYCGLPPGGSIYPFRTCDCLPRYVGPLCDTLGSPPSRYWQRAVVANTLYWALTYLLARL